MTRRRGSLEPSSSAIRIVLDEPSPLLALLDGVRQRVRSDPGRWSRVLSSLAIEGRRYAKTERGAELSKQLSQSELMRRVRLLWQAVGFDALVTEDAPAAGEVVERFLDETLQCHLERVVSDFESHG